MRSTRFGSIKLFSGVGLALAAGLIVLGATTTGAWAQIPNGAAAPPPGTEFSGNGGLDAIGAELNFIDQSADEMRSKSMKAEENAANNPDIIPIVGDSHGPDPEFAGKGTKNKDSKGPITVGTSEQSATVHLKSNARSSGVAVRAATAGNQPTSGAKSSNQSKIGGVAVRAATANAGDHPTIGAKSSNQSKIGGVVAPKPTATRQQIGSANSKPPAFLANAKPTASRQQFDSADAKPPAFLAAPKPSAPSFATPAARAGVR